MDDPSGIATISGGTIEGCKAVNGGAIYMTAGQFILSGTGKINNCSASQLGGAIYLGQTDNNKGTFTMNGGTIFSNKAIDGNGGAFYLNLLLSLLKVMVIPRTTMRVKLQLTEQDILDVRPLLRWMQKQEPKSSVKH